MTSYRGFLRGGALALLLAGSPAAFAAGTVELVSRAGRSSDTASGAQAQAVYPRPSFSADGRWVAFLSSANNLVAGQTAPAAKTGSDVFLHDGSSGATVLVSHSTASPTAMSDLGAESAALSADGRWVAFVSGSADLVPGQSSGIFHPRQLFLFDRIAGTTALIAPSPFLDANDGNGVREVAVSGDGRFVAFTSDAPDLVPGQQDDNNTFDVFLYDRAAASVSLVSHVPSPAVKAGNSTSDGLSLSADGRWLAFETTATDLEPASAGGVLLHDGVAGTLRRIGPGTNPVLSADGGTVAFLSADDHLAPGQVDANGAADVFRFDRASGAITLVSHTAASPTTAGNADAPAGFGAGLGVSADGRWVAFLSNATDLVSGLAANPGPALFLHDRTSGQVVLASRVGSSAVAPLPPALNPSIGGDGRFVAFESEAAGVPSVFLFDRMAGTASLVSGGDGTGAGFSYGPEVSADGSRVAYYSAADDLQPGVSDFNAGEDVVVFETAARSNAYATLHAPGAPSLTPEADSLPRALSGDGRYVLFESAAASLVAGQADANGGGDVFLYDRTAHSTLLVSRSTASPAAAGDDTSGSSSLSADGRFVVFASLASNLVAGVNDQPVDPETGLPGRNQDIFLFDRATGSTALVSRSAVAPDSAANGDSFDPAISADGRWVAFVSEASDLVAGVTDANRTSDVFLWDRATGARALVSRSSAGARKSANDFSNRPAISADGRYVLYESAATDLVPGQSDDPDAGTLDLFLFDRAAGTTALVTHARGALATSAGGFEDPLPALSADGRWVAFTSRRPDLTATPGGDLNVYLYDREGGGLTLVATSLSNSQRQLALSGDGRFLAFLSTGQVLATTPNADATDQLYVYDRIARTYSYATHAAADPLLLSHGSAENPTISADGRYVAFDATAPDLVAGQTGEAPGVFLFDRVTGARTVVSRLPSSAVASAGGEAPLISADGGSIAFDSLASALVSGDFNGRTDVFVFAAGGSGEPVSVTPCGLFNGGLRSGTRRILAVAGHCGVPAGAKQVVLKLTVSRGTAKGNVQLYPGNVANPSAGILRFNRGAVRSAGFTVPLGGGGIALLPFVNGDGTVRVGVEVDGYIP
jgi:Tol biopolymer transport system component